MSGVVYRVQDKEGRGPYRPGFSCRWSDPDGADHPPIQVEFGMGWVKQFPAGWSGGCAFISLSQAMNWFSAAECGRLNALGYAFVALRGCRVICRSPNQLVVVRPKPLWKGAIVAPWPHIDRAARLDPWVVAA